MDPVLAQIGKRKRRRSVVLSEPPEIPGVPEMPVALRARRMDAWNRYRSGYRNELIGQNLLAREAYYAAFAQIGYPAPRDDMNEWPLPAVKEAVMAQFAFFDERARAVVNLAAEAGNHVALMLLADRNMQPYSVQFVSRGPWDESKSETWPWRARKQRAQDPAAQETFDLQPPPPQSEWIVNQGPGGYGYYQPK